MAIPTNAQLEQALARAHAFAEKLLAENGRLRQLVAAAHVGGAAAAAARVTALERELEAARAQRPAAPGPEAGRSDLERELAELKRRHAELEEQHDSLANLYVSSYQLHSTLDFKEVVAIVMEIVTNLIGAEAFALLLVDGKAGELALVAAEGLSEPPTLRLPIDDGVLGTVARTGEPFHRPAEEAGEGTLARPLAAIPLKIKDQVIGCIAVLRLFPQKTAFSPVDHELFNLLAGHAATALFSAKLFSESERKLTTIQSFLDLLTTS